MFKTLFFGAFVVAVACANNFEQIENIIEYEPMPYRAMAMPYQYQEKPTEQQLFVDPFPKVLVPAPAVPVVTAVGLSNFGIVAKVASTAIAVVKKAFVFIIANAPALIIGTLAAFGICKFTPICAKLTSVKSLLAVPVELRSYATPERLTRAAEFVKTAIRKYRSLQQEL